MDLQNAEAEADPDAREMVDSIVRTVRTIVAAFIGSALLFGIVLLSTSGIREPAESWPALHIGLTLAAAAIAMGGLMVQRGMFAPKRIARWAAGHDVAYAAGEIAERRKALPDDGRGFVDVATGLTSRIVIALAHFEAVALFGFVLGYVYNDLTWYVPFGVISIALMAALWPDADHWHADMRSALFNATTE